MKPFTHLLLMLIPFAIVGTGAPFSACPFIGEPAANAAQGERISDSNRPNPSAVEFAQRTIELVDALEQDVAPADFTSHLLPIKKAAGWVWALAQGRTTLSNEGRASVLALRDALKAQKDFLMEETEVPKASKLMMELLEVSKALENDLKS